jgi:hypothetical protein
MPSHVEIRVEIYFNRFVRVDVNSSKKRLPCKDGKVEVRISIQAESTYVGIHKEVCFLNQYIAESQLITSGR